MKFRHLLAACAIAVAAPSAYALPMGLGLVQTTPDLGIVNVFSDFTATGGGAGTLMLTGDVANLEQPAGTDTFVAGIFGLTVNLLAGSVFDSGNFSIQGTAGPLGDFGGLLTGFGLSGNIFEFTGDVTNNPLPGGTADANFPLGGSVGIIVMSGLQTGGAGDANTLVDADFAANFQTVSGNEGVADLFATSTAVAEPSTLMLGMLALGLAFGGRIRRRLG